MRSKMLKLAQRYVESVKLTQKTREEMIMLLRQADAEFIFDETGRELALRQMQRDLYRTILADRLADAEELKDETPDDLVSEADRILDVPPAMRTAEETRLYGALRVRWFELMKDAGIRALKKGPQQ